MSSDRPLDGLMKAEEGDTSHTAFGASCNYQRHYDETDNHNNNTSNNNKDATASMSSRSWRFTDFGAHVESESSGLPQLSRDGSIHVTDEVFNSASHLAATLLSLLGSVLLIVESSSMANPWKIVSFSIYGASLLFLFSMSTLHHAISGHERIVNFLRMMDYLAIFPLIAGTFTPLCLVFYHTDPIGWAFCCTVWFVAVAGMIITVVCFVREIVVPKWLTMTLYITLGWFGACMTYWLLPVLSLSGFLLFLFGGIAYTVGGYIYSSEQPNPIPGKFGFHEIWHVAVILGALFHWLLMWFYVLPYDK